MTVVCMGCWFSESSSQRQDFFNFFPLSSVNSLQIAYGRLQYNTLPCFQSTGKPGVNVRFADFSTLRSLLNSEKKYRMCC